jgi:glycosyltransferase involved in cell wall biosynthesis
MNPVAETTVYPEQAVGTGPVKSEDHAGPVDLRVPITTNELPHVLYVIDQLCQLGGAERVLLELVRRLSPKRFRYSIVTFNLNPTMEALRNFPASFHNIPLKRTYDLNAARSAMHLRRLIRDQNVSIVHTFFETSDIWAAPVAKLSGCPILISSRRDMGILRTKKHQLAYPFVNRLFDRVLAVSDEVRGYCIRDDHLSPNQVETLYNGVDLVEIDEKAGDGDARQELDLCADAPVISTLANIRSIKGIDVLVRAAERVSKEFPKAVFLVVGGVLERETMTGLQEQVKSRQLADNFRFVGQMTNPFPVLRASNVFCLPSRSEGFSNALIEAMGCGLPCVATRVGGNAEALEEGKSGYLVASEDGEAMAERILQLLRDPGLARLMGAAARQTVKERFSMDAMMNRLMGIYDELLVAKNV